MLAVAAVAALIIVTCRTPCRAEGFQVSGEEFGQVVNAFFEANNRGPSREQVQAVTAALQTGPVTPDRILALVREASSSGPAAEVRPDPAATQGTPPTDKGTPAKGTPSAADKGTPSAADKGTPAKGTPSAADKGTPAKGTPAAKGAEPIALGKPRWTYEPAGLTIISVPYSLALSPTGGKKVALVVTVDAPPRSTLLSGLTASGDKLQPLPASGDRPVPTGSYEFMVQPGDSGEITFTQAYEQTSFAVTLSSSGAQATARLNADQYAYPPDDARSENVVFGVPARVDKRVRIPFRLSNRGRREGDSFRVTWRAPKKTTFLNRVEFGGQVAGARSVDAQSSDIIRIGSSTEGIVEMQQTAGANGSPAFTIWIEHGGDVSAKEVAASLTVDDDSAIRTPPFPPTVAPLPEVSQDMVDMDAFPFHRKEAMDTKVLSSSPMIEWDLVTAQPVSPGSRGFVVEVPFILKFQREDVPQPTPLVLNFDLDPATTILREVRHGVKAHAPKKTMTNADTFAVPIDAPDAGSQRLVAVFDQPSGRRAFRLDVGYAGHASAIMLAGDAAVPKGTGFVGSMRPFDFHGSPQPRFTDVHESAEERVRAVYKNHTSTYPDDQTTHFLMSKFFETQGDMSRIQDTVATIAAAVGKNGEGGNDDSALAVRQAIAAMEAGATPGEAKEALKNWKEYETHKAMWRPDQNKAGLAGAAALKRPWGEVAQDLAGGFSGSGLPAVAANLADDFGVYPGTSEASIGEPAWMFDSKDDKEDKEEVTPSA